MKEWKVLEEDMRRIGYVGLMEWLWLFRNEVIALKLKVVMEGLADSKNLRKNLKLRESNV